MQYRNLWVQGVKVRLTNAPGSGQTQVQIEGQPLYCYWPASPSGPGPGTCDELRLWAGPERGELAQPEGSAEFRAELLQQLSQHSAQRLAWYQRLKAGEIPGLHNQL